MSSKPIQVSMDSDLLHRIDEDPEVRERGRSAFIRSAVELYLHAKDRRRIDVEIERAYGGEGEALMDEVAELVSAQAWPSD